MDVSRPDTSEPDGSGSELRGPDLSRLAAALRAAPARAGDVRVLALDGRSGAGKTTLAARLGQALPAPCVSLEDLYGGWDGLAAGVGRLVAEVLVPLAAGRTPRVPRYDWTARAWQEPRPLTVAGGLLVVEGVGAGARAAAPYLSLLVWLEAPVALRRTRALARDGDVYTGHWDAWAAQESALLDQDDTRSRADIVLHTDR
ncbi:dephospho-CoA kinase [Frankia sp. R82]|uniref:dephospho-CoA kinase n=1 Tax=Frankia sp. R82 TaxID=2950553 RepID=UPI00204322AF|nr:dephospho-CoA kinase [Frankia sp. R82]MCM3882266.1 dephospho-CoA kinase [Frankia sp. R82]